MHTPTCASNVLLPDAPPCPHTLPEAARSTTVPAHTEGPSHTRTHSCIPGPPASTALVAVRESPCGQAAVTHSLPFSSAENPPQSSWAPCATYREDVGAPLGLLADGGGRVGGSDGLNPQLPLADAWGGGHRGGVVTEGSSTVGGLEEETNGQRGQRQATWGHDCRNTTCPTWPHARAGSAAQHWDRVTSKKSWNHFSWKGS